jgi:hypothetical protein
MPHDPVAAEEFRQIRDAYYAEKERFMKLKGEQKGKSIMPPKAEAYYEDVRKRMMKLKQQTPGQTGSWCLLQAQKERVEASGILGGESSSKRARKEMEGEGAVEEEEEGTVEEEGEEEGAVEEESEEEGVVEEEEGAVKEEDVDVKQEREEGGHDSAFSDLGLDPGAMSVEIPDDAEEQHEEEEEKGEKEKGLIFHFI